MLDLLKDKPDSKHDVGQRMFGIAASYEDPNDPDELRRDPVLDPAPGRPAARRTACAPPAVRSTLNRREQAPMGAHRYRRTAHDPEAIEPPFVDLLLTAGGQGGPVDEPNPP